MRIPSAAPPPDRARRAQVTQAKTELQALQKSRDGTLQLFYLDEVGFALTLPTTYT